MAVEIKEKHVTIVQGDSNNVSWRNRHLVHRTIAANGSQRRTHISQVPYFSSPVVGAGNHLIFSGESDTSNDSVNTKEERKL